MRQIKAVSSLASGRKNFNLGPFPMTVVRSDVLKDGEVIVDILASIHTLQTVFTFVVWQRHLTDDPRCDGCINHLWRAILPSPTSPSHADAMAAWLAASNYVIAEGIDGVYDDTAG